MSNKESDVDRVHSDLVKVAEEWHKDGLGGGLISLVGMTFFLMYAKGNAPCYQAFMHKLGESFMAAADGLSMYEQEKDADN